VLARSDPLGRERMRRHGVYLLAMCLLSRQETETELPCGSYPIDTSRIGAGQRQSSVDLISASPPRPHRQLRWPEPKDRCLTLPAHSPALRLPAASAVAVAPREKTRASGRIVVHVDRDFAPVTSFTHSQTQRHDRSGNVPAFCLTSLAITSQFFGSHSTPARDSHVTTLATTGRVGVNEATVGSASPRRRGADGSLLTSTPLAFLASV
jgi:hypothetical protein